MNKWNGIGNLTKDPDFRQTTGGVSVCTFTIAINRPQKDADGNRQADFIHVVVWRNQADSCGKYLKKGSRVAVNGSIQTRNYEDHGERKYITEVVASEVEFL